MALIEKVFKSSYISDIERQRELLEQSAYKIQMGRIVLEIEALKTLIVRINLKHKMVSKYSILYSIYNEDSDNFVLKHHIIKREDDFFRLAIENSGDEVQNIEIMYRVERIPDEECEVEEAKHADAPVVAPVVEKALPAVPVVAPVVAPVVEVVAK